MSTAVIMAAPDVVLCSLCDFRSPSLSLWLSHLRQVHRSDSGIKITCPVRGCEAVAYEKVNSLCSHMYRAHRALCTTGTSTGTVNDSVSSCSTDTTDVMHTGGPFFVTEDLQHNALTPLSRRKRAACTFFILKKRGCYHRLQ